MVRCYWIDAVGDLALDGADTVLPLTSAGETILLRGRRHITAKALPKLIRQYAELEAAERVAEVRPFKGRRRRHS